MCGNDFVFESDIAVATTIPSRWYLDPQVLRRECARVFGGTWQLVGLVEQVQRAGDFFTCTLVDEPLVITRAADGVLHGFYNVCRHRAGAVACGTGHRKSLQCRYHGWTYDLDGRLLTTPEFEGVQRFAKADNGLVPVGVDVWGPFVFVNLDPAAPALSTFLGAIPDETAAIPLERMRFFKRVDYEIACNWKVYVDNYLEGYHIPIAHPGLFKEINYHAYRVETARYYSKQHAPIRARPDSLYVRHLPEGASPQALYYWVFPNLMLNIYPDNLQVNRIVPLGHERTLTIFEWYVLDADRPEAAAEFEQSFAFSDLVQQEDIEICEAVQRGLGSRSYDVGRFSVLREQGVHHFHGLLAEFLAQGGVLLPDGDVAG